MLLAMVPKQHARPTRYRVNDSLRVGCADDLHLSSEADINQNLDKTNLRLGVQTEFQFLDYNQAAAWDRLKTGEQDNCRTLASAHVESCIVRDRSASRQANTSDKGSFRPVVLAAHNIRQLS